MKNEFVIPKNALLTCFTTFHPSVAENNNRNVIAYSALLKKDITVDFDKLPKILDLIGIKRIKIIYVNNPETVNQEFYDKIINFGKRNPSFNLDSCTLNPYSISTAFLKGYLHHALQGRIDVYKGEFDTQHCLFIFNGYN
jgi:hypothetical protein